MSMTKRNGAPSTIFMLEAFSSIDFQPLSILVESHPCLIPTSNVSLLQYFSSLFVAIHLDTRPLN